MSNSSVLAHLYGNHLLSSLSDNDVAALTPHLELVHLEFGQVVGERDQPLSHVYFPCSAVLSVLGKMRNSRAVAIGTIGNEGFYGIDVLLGAEEAKTDKISLCQIPGKALCLPAVEFARIISDCTSLRNVALRYISVYLGLMRQSQACNRAHTVYERVAYWLLLSHDRVAEDTFGLTPGTVAETLEIERAKFSFVATTYRNAGMIGWDGAQITILNREALEEASCECYGIIQQRFEKHIAPSRTNRGKKVTAIFGSPNLKQD